MTHAHAYLDRANRKEPTMTDPKLHELLDQTQFGDRLTLAHRSGKHTTRISGPVLTDQTHDPSVGIDLLDGDPHIVRTSTGVVWAPVVQATLHRGGEVIAKWDAADHLEAQQTEASLRRGLADITAGRTVDLGSFAQPEPEQPGGSNFMAWMADRLADPEVRAGYLAAHAREVREQALREAADEAERHADEGCPSCSNNPVSACSGANNLTAAWLRSRAEQTKEDR